MHRNIHYRAINKDFCSQADACAFERPRHSTMIRLWCRCSARDVEVRPHNFASAGTIVEVVW
jgi:hypothetical protein